MCDPNSSEAAADGVPTLELAAFLPYRLSIASNLVSKAFARRYETEFGLTIPEWRVMAVLGRHAPASSQEVSERTATDKVKISRAVTRLAASGLVTRAQNPSDQRQNKLSLTRKGRAIYQKIVPRAFALERELLEAFTPEETELLHRLLRRLEARVKDIAPPA